LTPAGPLVPIALDGFPLVAGAPGFGAGVPGAAGGPEEGERLLRVLLLQVVHVLHLSGETEKQLDLKARWL
jgi:hypothetical protein